MNSVLYYSSSFRLDRNSKSNKYFPTAGNIERIHFVSIEMNWNGSVPQVATMTVHL